MHGIRGYVGANKAQTPKSLAIHKTTWDHYRGIDIFGSNRHRYSTRIEPNTDSLIVRCK